MKNYLKGFTAKCSNRVTYDPNHYIKVGENRYLFGLTGKTVSLKEVRVNSKIVDSEGNDITLDEFVSYKRPNYVLWGVSAFAYLGTCALIVSAAKGE